MDPKHRESLIDYIASHRAELESVDSFFSEKLLYALIRMAPWEPGDTALNDLSDSELLQTYLEWFDLNPNEYEEDALVEQLIYTSLN